jgi:hypothetical protein
VIETRSASTAETRYRGLRGFFGWPEEEGADPVQRRMPSGDEVGGGLLAVRAG